MKKSISLFLLLFISLFSNAQIIEKTYIVEKQSVKSIYDYSQIELKDCMQSALVGQPSLPWHSVRLLLPEGTKAESMEVEMTDFQELEGRFDLFPYQPARTYSDRRKPEFYKDETVYSSKNVYPAENQGVLTTQYVNGYPLAIATFTPVKYFPSERKVLIAKTVNVKIRVCSDGRSNIDMRSSRPQIINKVKSLVDNPEMIDNYAVDNSKSLQGYELLVVTPEQYIADFDDYLEFYDRLDLRTNIVSVESIYETMQGVDNQEKIRNFIIQEYQDNDILMVLLGGDVALVPYRGLYADVISGGSHNIDNGIPADLYFAALDGSWNNDGDEHWGEPGEDDLYPEIGVARMPFNNVGQLADMIHKTIQYQQFPVLGEFTTVALGGEKLYDNPYTQGSQYLELLIGEHDDNGYSTKGIDEDYNFKKFYAEEGNWSGSNLRGAINSGVGYVHHAGHANTDMVAGWTGSTLNPESFSGANGVDHNYTFFHSHGCDCGGFDKSCVMERLVTMPYFAVSVIGNSRYGWFNEGQTEGPSIHLQREMTDAFWAERIPYIGMALSEAKCQTAPWVTAPGQFEEGALRWNFYDLNILGDVAVSPWHEEPFDAAVSYRPAMLLGEQTNEIHVSHNGQPLKNFRCSISDDFVKLGEAVTDDNGDAVITLSEPVSSVGQLYLTVTGMNSYLQSRIIECIDENTTFVKPYRLIANDGDGDGMIEPHESVSFDLVVKNWGMATANDLLVMASSCDTEYFRYVKNEATFESIEGQSVDTIHEAFVICMNDDVPNGWHIGLNITSTDQTGYWYNSFAFKAYAPDIQIVEMSCDELDGNDNGVIEPGESGILNVKVINNGSITADNVLLEITKNTAFVELQTSSVTIEQLLANEYVICQFTFDVYENAPNCTLVNFYGNATCGKYNSSLSTTITIGYMMDDFETGDLSKLEWQLGGDDGWFVTDSHAYEGTFSARSGIIGHDEISSLIINISVFEKGNLSFYLKTSTEKNDYLALYVDDVYYGRWSEENDWQSVNYELEAGNHKLEWRYDKSKSATAGLDAVFIDNVTFPVNSTIITDVAENIENQDDVLIYPNPNSGSFKIITDGTSNTIVVYNSLGQVVYEKENASQNETVEIKDAGVYYVRINENIKKLIIK